MSNVIINDSHLTNIASAIRSKNGTSTKYKPGEMAEAINDITASEDLSSELTTQNTLLTTQEGTIEDIILALQNKTAGSGEGITPTGEIEITENGTYDVTNYASANVNVSLGTAETWTFTMEDGSTVTKEVVIE